MHFSNSRCSRTNSALVMF
uniref:Uncharacterized protein n=1 Tax=Anguilla anguilla TaxID=7936 RepID=A0A0E9SQI5_ANGAN